MSNIIDKFKREYKTIIKKNYSKQYNIQAVSEMLGIKNNNLPYNLQCLEIIKFLESKKKNNPTIEYLLVNLKDKDLCDMLVNVLYNLFHPDSIEDSDVKINKNKYYRLIKKYQNDNINDEENKILQEYLNIKYCKCLKKIFMKNLLNEVIFQNDKQINQYAICMSSIYNKRNIKPKNRVSHSCSDKYKWYN